MAAKTAERTNRFLTLLSDEDYERLRPHLPQLIWPTGTCFAKRSAHQFVYFPIDGVASLVNVMEEGSAAEVGTIGSEGIVGLPLVFGDHMSKSVISPGFLARR